MKPAGVLRLAAIVLALAAFAALVVSGPGYRFGWWSFRAGIWLVQWAGYVGAAAVLVTLAALAWPKARGGWSGTLAATLLIAAAVVGVTLAWGLRAKSVPAIHDLSTDTDNPPAFVAVVPLRKGAENPLEYGGAALAAKQRQAYPDIKPLVLTLPPEAALARARIVAQEMGWEVVATDLAAGRVEATDTTPWFGFKDDIVVRITPAGAGSRVDVRSVSRVGRSDLGTNARRIRAYLERLRNS